MMARSPEVVEGEAEGEVEAVGEDEDQVEAEAEVKRGDPEEDTCKDSRMTSNHGTRMQTHLTGEEVIVEEEAIEVEATDHEATEANVEVAAIKVEAMIKGGRMPTKCRWAHNVNLLPGKRLAHHMHVHPQGQQQCPRGRDNLWPCVKENPPTGCHTASFATPLRILRKFASISRFKG